MAVPLRVKLERLHRERDARAERYWNKAKWWREQRRYAYAVEDYKRARYCDERFDHWMDKAGREARLCRDIESHLKIIAPKEVVS
jgi:hypothetical protein